MPNNQSETGIRDIISRSVMINNEMMGGNYWLTRSNLNSGRNGLSSFTLGSYLFTTAGFTSTRVLDHEAHDDITNVWTSRANFNLPATVGCISFALTMGYVGFGTTGSNTSAISGYNDWTNTWTTKTSGNVAKRNMCASDLNGYGYVPQGFTSGVSNAHERYDESTNSWSNRASSSITADENAVITVNDLLVSAYGRTNPGVSNTAASAAYNDVTNAWSTISASSGTTRSGPSGFSCSGIGHVATGRGLGLTPNFADNDKLDIDNRVWTTRAPNATALSLAIGGSLNGNGYVCGGQTGSGIGINNVTQYKNYHPYLITAPMKSTLDVPKSVSVKAEIEGKAVDIPMQIRTDGSNWRPQTTGAPLTLRPGETFMSVYGPSTNGVKKYEIMLGIPKFISGLGGGYWISKADGSGRFRLAGLSLNGYGYAIAGRQTGNARTNSVNQYNNYDDAWVAKTSLGTANQGSVGFELNGLGYSCGGSTADNSTTAAVNQYNDELNSWATKTSMGTARQAPSSYSLSGFGYVVGGSPTDSNGATNGDSTVNEQYNDVTNAWSTKTAIPNNRRFSVSFSANQNGYTSTGINASNVRLTSNEQYNDAANSWSTKTGAPLATFGCMGFYANGLNYLSFGNPGSLSTDLFQYNDIMNLWFVKSNGTGAARNQGCGFSIMRSGYAFAGSDAGGGAVNTLSQYVTADTFSNVNITLDVLSTPLLIAANGVWSSRTANPVARSGVMAFGIDGKSLCGLGDDASQAYNRADNFDDTLNSWSTTGSVTTARRYAAGLLAAGFGYAAGGMTFGSSTGLTNFDRYDSSLGTWSARAGITVGRTTATGMSTASFGYVVGGSPDNTTIVQTNYRYNESGNSWSTMTDIPTLLRRAASFTINDVPYYTHGETSGSAVVAYGYKYNVGLNLWTIFASSSVARHSPAGFGIGDSGFIACGTTGSNIAATDEYLPGSNVWVTRPSNALARSLLAGSNVGSNGFAACGFTSVRVATMDRYAKP